MEFKALGKSLGTKPVADVIGTKVNSYLRQDCLISHDSILSYFMMCSYHKQERINYGL